MSDDADDSGAADGDGVPDDSEFHTSFASPKARASEARNAALDHLSSLDPNDPNTSKIELLEKEENAVGTWAKHAAKAIEDGYPDAAIEAHAGAIADECQHYTKKNAISTVQNQRQRLRKAGGVSGSGPPPLDEWIESELERVVRLETTDNTQDTMFRWDFSEGTVETGTTKDGVTHFSWSHFRDEIYQGLGENTAKPVRKEAEEWRQWLAELIEQRGETRTNFGPRSHGVERLQSYVRDSMAFGDKGDVVEREGVYLDEDPGQGSPSELRVLAKDVKRICDDVEIEVRGLQQELDARGHTHDDIAGVSDGEYVNGSMVRFWVLDPDFADPIGYMEEAQSPADAVAEQQDDDEDGDGGGGAPTPASVSATAAPTSDDGAQLSSIGPGDGEGADDEDGDTDEADDADADDASADVHSDEQATHSDAQPARSGDGSDEGDGSASENEAAHDAAQRPDEDGGE